MQALTTTRYRAKPELKTTLRNQGRMAAWVAERIGMSRPQMSHVLAGRRTLTAKEAERVAELIGVPFFLLFECAPDASKYLDKFNQMETVA